MSSKNKRGPDTLLPSLFLLPGQLSHKTPVRMLLALSHSYTFCSGTQVSLIHGPPAHEGGYLLPVIREKEMHCPNCGSQNIQLRHVGKKTGGVIGATAGGLAGLEGASTGALIGSAIPVVGTIVGGLIGFLSGACAGAVAGSLAGEQLDGTVFDEYGCTQCEHIFSAP